MLVLDASAALGSALNPKGFDRITALDPIGPPLLWSDAISAVRQAQWRGEVTEDVAEEALRRLLAAPIRRRSPNRLYQEAWSIARELGWAKTYDAEYLALAQIFECPLLTRDARLKRGADHLVEIIGPADL